MRGIMQFGVLLLLLGLVAGEIQPLDKGVLAQIYQENKVYVIYVHGTAHNFEVEAVFNSYCFGEKACAILEPNNPDYYHLLQFVGYTSPEYFLILDSTSRRKYVQPVPQPLTTNDLLAFEYKFHFKELQPFFASEPLPAQLNLRCSKLVGKNVGAFLRRKERVKVILLYHLNENCESCDHVLQKYMPFAQQSYDQKTLAFGYFNTFLNDHPIIHDEKAPSFIVFVDQQYQTPFSLQAGSLDNLSYFVSKMIGQQLGENKQLGENGEKSPNARSEPHSNRNSNYADEEL